MSELNDEQMRQGLSWFQTAKDEMLRRLEIEIAEHGQYSATKALSIARDVGMDFEKAIAAQGIKGPPGTLQEIISGYLVETLKSIPSFRRLMQVLP